MTDSTASTPQPATVEVLYSSGPIETIRWGDLEVSGQLDGDRIDIRATNGDGRLVYRDTYPATAQGISGAAKRMEEAGTAPEGSGLPGHVIGSMTYRILDATTAGPQTENLLAPVEHEGETYRLDPTVKRDEANLLVGRSGGAKTISAVGQMLAITSGEPIGLYVPSGEVEPVLMLDGEDIRRNIRNVAQAIGKGHGIDVDALEREGLLHWREVNQPIIGQGPLLRRIMEKEGITTVIIDSVDTARGPDAPSQTGVYFDTVRHLPGSSLSVDHVTKEIAARPMATWEPYGSVKAINRPRQTWAQKADRDGDNSVAVRMRLNFTNREGLGTEIGYGMKFEMRSKGVFDTIVFGGANEVEPELPTKSELVLLAIQKVEATGSKISYKDIERLTDLSNSEVSNGVLTLRRQGRVTEPPAPLGVTGQGTEYIKQRWLTDPPRLDV